MQPYPRRQEPPIAPLGTPPAEPTQRYSIAPNAPQPVPYNRPGIPNPADSRPLQSAQQTPLPPRGDSGSYYSQPLYNRFERDEDTAPGLDVVTIALAVLAFFAVACLIPLYIAVFQARFGG